MKLLVTGGAGFIGSNFTRYILQACPGVSVINLDKLTYAGNLENLADLADHPRHAFIHGDICDRRLVGEIFSRGVDAVINFAAESHVDRSIVDASPFIETNVRGTQVLLDAAAEYWKDRFGGRAAAGAEEPVIFIQVSTDEVYGSLGPEGRFTEGSPLKPSSPYSASKAAADLLALAYHRTYGLPVVITRCSNNYGPYQFPEKLIPLMITNALENQPLPVYGDGLNMRDWLHVEDHCRALELVLFRGKPGEVYNIGGHGERTNLEVVQAILKHLGKPESLIRFVKDRPGHDRRYAIDPSKITRELGWEPRHKFEEGLAATVEWYIINRSWWERIKSGAYREYYQKMYGAIKA
ncbi:dTDP-glucose 4,6-dehydratase [Desulfofundulus thermosubterraneus]|uniref:dTDP-glucose 4,6-dehydratase n=1 Tax=Desulfofundulus thermosubterraneus DSM 16057 TaxID=1121432 RepID=A0A1M6EVK8_9FIRM|nr:dTDP-glucose 4,6-dehydratase [Desulfofundulus thermosubterraneus]SHI89475.1 dTDP-glucose 4,6-dehydratase [Desulfofundulus thermosubterraneus DSM 16057]